MTDRQLVKSMAGVLRKFVAREKAAARASYRDPVTRGVLAGWQREDPDGLALTMQAEDLVDQARTRR